MRWSSQPICHRTQIVDLAKYVSQVEESSAFHEQVNQLVEDGKSESAVELLVKQTDALVDSEEGLYLRLTYTIHTDEFKRKRICE